MGARKDRWQNEFCSLFQNNDEKAFHYEKEFNQVPQLLAQALWMSWKILENLRWPAPAQKLGVPSKLDISIVRLINYRAI